MGTRVGVLVLLKNKAFSFIGKEFYEIDFFFTTTRAYLHEGLILKYEDTGCKSNQFLGERKFKVYRDIINSKLYYTLKEVSNQPHT